MYNFSIINNTVTSIASRQNGWLISKLISTDGLICQEAIV